jgi:hypothetical protein
VVVECLKLYLDVRGLHDLVDFPILLAADEVPVFIRQFDLEANLVMEGLNDGVGKVNQQKFKKSLSLP